MTLPHNKELSRRALLGLGGLGALGIGAAVITQAFPGKRTVHRSAVAFGTVVSITLVDDGSARVQPAFADAFAAIRGIERAANLFDPRSEISRLNRDGHLPSPSAHMRSMLDFALRLSAATDGAYDPSVLPIWLAWQAARRESRQPSEADLATVTALVDWRQIRATADSIALASPGMSVTLNSVAQGYATDLVLRAVAAHGVRHAFIDTGEVGAEGHRPDGGMWRVAIASPRTEERKLGVVSVTPRRFFATSADNACRWTEDYREHHIVEPWSGHSPVELAEVVVAASSGLAADGLSTAAMVVGAERARSLLRTMDPGASALFIDKAGRTSAEGPEFRHLA